MLPSTSLASRSPAEATGAYGLEALAGFYRRQAWLYDWTRPFILFGRGEAVAALAPGPGHVVLDVGCGTGRNLEPLARTGAEVVGIECTPAMLERARARIVRLRPGCRARLDPRPYGTHEDYRGAADRILFSYSLSMIPPFEEVLARAREDLRPGGSIAVVDFLDAVPPFSRSLELCHVRLGRERLDGLRRLFPRRRESVRRAGPWRYYLFCGESE